MERYKPTVALTQAPLNSSKSPDSMQMAVGSKDKGNGMKQCENDGPQLSRKVALAPPGSSKGTLRTEGRKQWWIMQSHAIQRIAGRALKRTTVLHGGNKEDPLVDEYRFGNTVTILSFPDQWCQCTREAVQTDTEKINEGFNR